MAEGRFDVRTPVNRYDEFGLLALAFNSMAEGLQQRERMRRFVSESVWRQSEHEAKGGTQLVGGEKITVAVLFSDIRGFTSLCEQHSPQLIVGALNEYFTTMDQAMRPFKGEIDKLIGDAIFAVFRWEDGTPHPASRAVEAALCMRNALDCWNRQREKNGQFILENGFGIHFGEVISGKVGSRVGRLDLTVIGPVVDEASALEGISKRGRYTRIIVSNEVVECLKELFAFENIDRMTTCMEVTQKIIPPESVHDR